MRLDSAKTSKDKGDDVVLYRTRFAIGGLVVVFLFLVTLRSCDQVERHKVFTFFLDGVPPLGGEEIDEEFFDANTPQVRRRPEVVWYVHEPARSKKDCVLCHGNRQQRSFSREVQLTAKFPDVCYECHEDLRPEALEGRVHGPVAAGECLFCHEPHKTREPHLLRMPIPELCFWCHEEAAIGLIPDHSKEIYSRCNYCHEGHLSSVKYLLKPGWEEKAVEVEEPEPEDEIKEAEPEDEIKESEPKDEIKEAEPEAEIEEPESEAGSSVQ